MSRPAVRTIIRPPRVLELAPRELWRSRELLAVLVWRDLKVRYKQTVIGVAWAALQPLLVMVIFVAFFSGLVREHAGAVPAPAFFFPAVALWGYVAQAVSRAAASIVDHQQVVTKVYFPRLLLPVAGVASAFVDFCVASLLLVGLLLAYGVAPTSRLALAPAFVLLAVVASLGAGLWLAALNARYRDVRHALPFLTQVWLFASPVAYSAGIVPERFLAVYALNPVAGAIEGLRWALLGQGALPVTLVLGSTASALALLVSGLVYFQRTDVVVADVV